MFYKLHWRLQTFLIRVEFKRNEKSTKIKNFSIEISFPLQGLTRVGFNMQWEKR